MILKYQSSISPGREFSIINIKCIIWAVEKKLIRRESIITAMKDKKDENIRETAILIAKNISSKKTAQEDAVGIQRMKLGFFDASTKKDIRKYYFEFMTGKGPITFLVPANIYAVVKIDSLGILESHHHRFVNFIFEKIATPADVQRLGW